MTTEQTIRDNVVDAIEEYLLSKSHEDEYLQEDKKGLADAVFEAIGISEREQDYLKDESKVEVFNKDKISSSWSTEDVQFQAKEMKLEITHKQAQEVLSLVDHKMDANIGITWDVFEFWISHVLTESKNRKLKT